MVKLPSHIIIGPFSLQTFTLFLALAVAASVGIALYHSVERRGAVADAYLVALIIGVVGARAGHILLNWNYFAYNSGDMVRLNTGGLDWHGAVAGGLIGMAFAARWRGLKMADLLDLLTPGLPLIALAGWWGCWASNCGYGAEVDTLANYPAFVVSEAPDVYGILAPRYNTPLFGLLLSALILGTALLISQRGWLHQSRFWLILALLSGGMFSIGFVRGDYGVMIGGLRADQWLDLMMFVISCFIFILKDKRIWRTTT